MERRQFFNWIAAGTLSGPGMLNATAQGQENCAQTQHLEWVVEVMERMQTIHQGMTRRMLKTVFRDEGGLSTRRERTYVSQDCPCFKVKVNFEMAGNPDPNDHRAWLDESDDDIISKMSDPYLQFSIMD